MCLYLHLYTSYLDLCWSVCEIAFCNTNLKTHMPMGLYISMYDIYACMCPCVYV